MSQTTDTLVLNYWPIKARNWFPLLLAAYGGVELGWERTADEDTWYKAGTPFGQLPALKVNPGPNGIVLGQSLAISRYISRLAKLDPADNLEQAKNDMLIQQMDDMLGALSRAYYAPGGRKEAMDKLLNENLPVLYGQLQKLLKGETFFSSVYSGDIAIFSVLNIIADLQPNTFEKFPQLSAFYEKFRQNPKFKALLEDKGIEQYYLRQ